MSWWFGNNSVKITVLDFGGNEYNMTMDQNNTILDIKREIFQQNPEYTIYQQKLMYTPNGAPIPNVIPNYRAYKDNTYNKENPYYILSDEEKLSFWKFPDEVSLHLFIDPPPRRINLIFTIYREDARRGFHVPENERIFELDVIPGTTFKHVFSFIQNALNVSKWVEWSGLSDQFTLWRIKTYENIYEGYVTLVDTQINEEDIIEKSDINNSDNFIGIRYEDPHKNVIWKYHEMIQLTEKAFRIKKQKNNNRGSSGGRARSKRSKRSTRSIKRR